jgi:hypothetical protein
MGIYGGMSQDVEHGRGRKRMNEEDEAKHIKTMKNSTEWK